MKKKYTSLLKNIGLFTIGNFGSKIVSFLMIPLYTAILSTNDYGTVDLLNSTAQLLIPILLLSIQDATLRFGMDQNYKKEDVISTTINIVIKGTITFLFVMIIIYFSNIIKLSIVYWIFLFFTFLLYSLNNCFNLYLKAENKAYIIAIGGILCTIITCTSNIICLIVFKLGINGYMISNLIGILFQVLFQFIFGKIYKNIHLKKYNDLSKPMISYSAPLITNSIAWWVNNTSDRYILTWMHGTAINGIYAVAYKIPTILTTFQSIFYNAWSISAISEFNRKDEDGFIGNSYTVYSLLSIIVCSLILLFNIPIGKILYSADYFVAWQYVPFLMVSTVFNGIAQFEGSLFAATKKTNQVSITTFIGATINIIGNFILIYKFGAVGAALSTMIGYGVTWILRTIFLQRFITMKVNWKLHICIISLLIIQSILATINIIYFMQIIIFVLIIALNYKYISNVLQKIAKTIKW